MLASTYVRRHCTTAHGTFAAFVSGGSSLKVLDPRGLRIERVHQQFIENWVAPDAVVWDIGANLGLFALPAALKARQGRVYAFEPDVELAANLLRTLRLRQNRALNLSLLCLAVADIDGVANFQISKYSRAMNKLEAVGEWHDRQVAVLETRVVAKSSIDTLARCLTPPSVIKIDVEGGDMAVLAGAAGVIAKYRPAILVEGPSELWDAMGAFFRGHEYVMLDGAAAEPEPLAHPVWDTVAIARENFERSSRGRARATTLAGASAG